MEDPAAVSAIVLTFRRPRLATDVVRNLIEIEGIPPKHVLLVVNGEGGLSDEGLERSIDVLRLERNLGPAGGYRAGLLRKLETTAAPWFYLCEDDVGLFDLPSPRLQRMIEALEKREDRDRIGGVVAYGRRLDPRTGFAFVHHTSTEGFEEVDVAPWGASLLSRTVVEAGVLPDESWFFELEDFDFWLSVKRAGFAVLVDGIASQAAASFASGAGREEKFEGERPRDADEAWRAYYFTRNFLEFRRRWGTPVWTLSHLLKTSRRFQLAPSPAHRRAIVSGLRDGFRGSLGKSEEYQRSEGEY